MIKLLTIFCCIVCFSFLKSTPNRCVEGFANNRDRPELDTFYLSESGHFKIHYDINNDNGNIPPQEDIDEDGVPDYIESVAEIAEESRDVLVNIMGYLPEPPDDEEGVYDIYVRDQNAWGYNWVNTTEGWSYITIDNDYPDDEFESAFCLNMIDKMKISVAHEFFHAIQRSYRLPIGDHDFFLEMSSMWFEDLMVPDCNEYLDDKWIRNLSYTIFNNPTQQFDGGDLSVNQSSANFGYSMALFGHYLSRVIDEKGMIDEFNSTIMREIWEDYSTSSDIGGLNAAGASIKNVVENISKEPFSQAWSDFISSNMLCGQLDLFNDIYYYPDQQLIAPIVVGQSDLLQPNSIDNIDIDLEYNSASISSSLSLANMYLDFEISDISDISGYYVVKGLSSDRGRISNSASDILINTGGLFSFVFSPKIEDVNVNAEITSTPVPLTQVINVYPNPLSVNNDLYIDIESSDNVLNYNIKIYDTLGRCLHKFDYENLQLGLNEKIVVPITELDIASGIYFVEISISDNQFFSKIVLIK